MNDIGKFVAVVVLVVAAFMAVDYYGDYRKTTDLGIIAENAEDTINNDLRRAKTGFSIESAYAGESGDMVLLVRNTGTDTEPLNADELSLYIDGQKTEFTGCDSSLEIAGTCEMVLPATQFPEEGFETEIKLVHDLGIEELYICVPTGGTYC